MCLLVVAAVAGLPMPSRAQQVYSLGFEVFNTVPPPAEVTPYPGDIRFSDDGGTALFIGDSEGTGSGVWTASVNRDADGNVTSFGPASVFFLYPNLDTSLEQYTGSDTLFFTVYESGIGQRSPLGAIEIKMISGYGCGGLALIPEVYTTSPALVDVDFDLGQLFRHTVTDDGDDTYTIGDRVLVSSLWVPGTSDPLEPGDVEYILTGKLADTMLVADYSGDTVYSMAIDPATGLPVGGGSPSLSLFAGLDEVWGLAVDPVSHNIWLVEWGSGPLVQIVEGMFSDGFESGGTNRWSLTTP